jgi:glycerophosphoryl diester phosphodiesterase
MFKSCFISLLLVFSYNLFAAHCIAHRGVHDNVPENSLASLKRAHEFGSDGVELDISHTKDGKAILLHDAKLKRIADHNDQHKCPLNKHISKIDSNTIKNNCQYKINDEPINFLDQALIYLKNISMLVFLEFKDAPQINTLNIIKQAFKDKPERLRIISFFKRHLNVIDQMALSDPFWSKVKLLHLRLINANHSNWGQNLWFVGEKISRNKFEEDELGVWTINSEKWLEYYHNQDHINFITTDDVLNCQKFQVERKS